MTPTAPLAALIAAALAMTGAASAAPLTVTVDGIEARGGKLYVSVQTEDQFMKEDGVAGEILEAPEAGSKTLSFDLPEGRYAVSVWHDFNGNGAFDVDDAGMPADGWTSPNAASLQAAPTFEQSSVTVEAGGAALQMDMIYPR